MARCIAAIALVIAPGALAQTASVSVSHDDLDGKVSPGETIRVTVAHSRDAGAMITCLAHVEGDVVVSPNLGQTNGFTSPYIPPLPFWSTVNPGIASGGGLLGFAVEFTNHPMFWAGLLPYVWVGAEVEPLSFYWTAPSVPSPTNITFSWIPSANHPSIEIYDFFQIQSYPIPTTYTSTSIVVLPTPGAGTVVAVGGLLAAGRRRPRA